MYIVIRSNRLRIETELTPIERLWPLSSGRRLELAGPIPVRVTGDVADIGSLVVQGRALFARRQVAAAILRSLPNLIQIFELEADDSNVDEIQAVNSMRAIDCIDFEKSDVDVSPEEPKQCRTIRSLALNYDLIPPGELLFWVKRSGLVLASEEGKRMLIGAGVPDKVFRSELLI